MNTGDEPDKGRRDLVSVIMPAYNAEPHIQEAIKTVHNELKEAGINHEIIVVNVVNIPLSIYTSEPIVL